MSDDRKQEPKKGIPNGFIWFLMGAFLLALMVQSMIDTKFAKVAFSYQLEHLVNLQLIQPEDSRKTAANDNLVTFSGKFRERLTEEGKHRYKYLELLDQNHKLEQQRIDIEREIDTQKNKALDATDWFLNLSGLPMPKEGYVIADTPYPNLDKDSSILLTALSPRSTQNLASLKQQYASLTPSSPPALLAQFAKELDDLIRNFRSPLLGIGNESLKLKLRELDRATSSENIKDMSPADQLQLYGQALTQLSQIVDQLNRMQNSFRLTELRSVRNYQVALSRYQELMQQLDDNQAQLDKERQAVTNVIWFFNNKELSTRALEKQDPEQFQHWFINAKEEWEAFPQNKGGLFRAPDQPLSSVLEKTFKSEEPPPNYLNYLFTLLPVALIFIVLYALFSRQMKGVGSSAMNFGKSPAKLLNKDSNKLTFKDVAGIDEAIEELQEIVEFLRNPQKFTSLGGRIPKGVLCVGPPGTGKTLIAKAVAGEADRPFFSISGSDFVEMFVGVGASRIRDLFNRAKENAPCIIFMDEIDAVGRHRGAGIGGGHDEREQTLNQLLVEMDGFDTNEGVILMAATNRPDVLDKALLRPGRFDRRVIISLPDIKGRYEILKVHARKIKLDPCVDLMAIARSTPGASGADLANLLNEAALLAARRNRTAVTAQDTVEARDKVFYGKERRNLEIDEHEKRHTAYHEAGHAIVGLVVKHSDPVDKVTIIPRGMSLGSTMFLPQKNRLSFWKQEALDKLSVLMGGQCAEEIFVGDTSSGVRQDLEQATHLARSMVCEWGMSEHVGTVAYEEHTETGQYLGMGGYHERKYSEATAQMIDTEVRRLLTEAHERAREIILSHRTQVELMVQMLLEFETLNSDDVRLILSGHWDVEEKRKRLKIEDELHKKPSSTVSPVAFPPPLPPLPNDAHAKVSLS